MRLVLRVHDYVLELDVKMHKVTAMVQVVEHVKKPQEEALDVDALPLLSVEEIEQVSLREIGEEEVGILAVVFSIEGDPCCFLC